MKNLSILQENLLADKDLIFIKEFKGGSGAHTKIVERDSMKFVRKIGVGSTINKLKFQSDWLSERHELPHIPQVARKIEGESFFLYEMHYDPSYMHFIDFIEKEDIDRSWNVLKSILEFVGNSIHVNNGKVDSTEKFNRYVNIKVVEKLNIVREIVPNAERILSYEYLVVNEVKYLNCDIILKNILQNKEIVKSLSSFNESPLHGDLTIDNILVKNDGSYLLLDPNNENYISTPIVDYAKLYQSLHSGYEYLCKLDRTEIKENEIFFNLIIKENYNVLFNKMNEWLLNHLGPNQFKLVKFHEAVHYSRLLPYKINENNQNFWAYFATMVKLFNEFYRLY